MKILLLEYITGGGLAGSALPDSLAQEGRLMAHALAEDLLAMPNLKLHMLWDVRLPLPDYAADERICWRAISDATMFQRCWMEGLRECDAVWPIAPETDGVLERLCRDAALAGLRLLNSPASAVALTASKSATCQRLIAHGIACVPGYPLHALPADLAWPRVIKPDDGVGCEGVYRLDELKHWEKHCADLPAGNWLVQPYLRGPSLSLSALFWQGHARLLTVNRQQIDRDTDGKLRLSGCEVNAVQDSCGIYADLVQRIAQAMPELAGYVGVDFIQTRQGPQVVEINPRLTSSYVLLGRSLGINPAKWVLELFERGELAYA